jgi:cell division protein FtsL
MSSRVKRPSAASVWAQRGLAEQQHIARFHRDRDRRRLKSMARGLCGAGLVVGLVLGVVALRVQQVRLSYRLDGLRAARAELGESHSRLRVELYSLQSLARIEAKARELGMQPPSANQVQLAREFVPGGSGMSASAPLTASAEDPRRAGAGIR